jgi:signal transduction histidine kinase
MVGDQRLLERLIANLIDNAIRHNTRGGRVDIATGTRDRHAFVSIANSGRAVPPEQIERLFQPFQRLGGARTRHNDGYGLGLSIVKVIADAHRAELTVRPRPEGRPHHRGLVPAGTRLGRRGDVRGCASTARRAGGGSSRCRC